MYFYYLSSSFENIVKKDMYSFRRDLENLKKRLGGRYKN